MRHFLVPVLLLALAGGAGFAAVRADRDGRPEAFAVTTPGPSASTAVLSARRVPGIVSQPAALDTLSSALATAASNLPPDTCLLADHQGDVVFEQRPDAALTPASTIKLLTAAVALDVLGPDHTYRTTVLASDPVDDGVVEGNRWLVGGGDPVVATD